MSQNLESTCFGMYDGSSVCQYECALSRQCKSFTISDGLDVVGNILEELIGDLPADKTYFLTETMASMLLQVKNPETAEKFKGTTKATADLEGETELMSKGTVRVTDLKVGDL